MASEVENPGQEIDRPDNTIDKTSESKPWARVVSVASLVVGIIGVGLSWIPVVGRMIAIVCAPIALLTGYLGSRYTAAGIKKGRHACAIAGVTLGFVCLFEALRLSSCAAITGAATDALTGLVS